MNYVIKGSSRCGKTLLANLIAQRLVGYSKFSTDNLIKAFMSAMPEAEINRDNGRGMKECFPKFLINLLNNTKKRDNKLDIHYVLEGTDISDSVLEEFNKQEDVTVICMGKPNLTKEEYFKEVRYFEKIYLFGDWTKTLSDSELLSYCEKWIEESKRLQKLCQEKGYLFFDTSFKQEKVINGIFKKITKSRAKNLQKK